jgi:murein DD-endopeptidase MepM/ murein hydrolase activator NlpD
MIRLVCLLLLSISFAQCDAQAFLSNPIDGKEGTDYCIVNYVDWSADTTNPIKDYHCGSKTYDGHQGTDFLLKSFPAMDSGVNVLAVADGRVCHVQDGIFDREKESIISKGFGNYVCIHHDNGYYSYYAHLKKNSTKVKINERVKRGDVLGQIASSGNSTDPHLHFELWYDSSVLVDPFGGSCGNASSLWLNTPNYDTTFRIWESGFTDSIATLNKIRERQSTYACCPLTILPSSSKPISYWALINGIRENDELTVNWYTPQKTLWYNYSTTVNSDYWYYYFWTYINHENLAPGQWNIELLRNDKVVKNDSFFVQTSSLKEVSSNSNECPMINQMIFQQVDQQKNNDIKLFDINGHEIPLNPNKIQKDIEKLPAGSYFLLYTEDKHQCTRKFLKTE